MFFEKKSHKFVVKDVLKNERQVKQTQKRKREERDDFVSNMLPKQVKEMLDLEGKAKNMHKRKKINENDMDIDDMMPLKYMKKKPADKSKGRSFH